MIRRMLKVEDSSLVSAVGFDRGTMRVQFKNESVYEYYEVPQRVFLEMVNAPSVGKAFHRLVKGGPYKCRREP